jgi:carbon-monoxide dehydrogenase small subunit
VSSDGALSISLRVNGQQQHVDVDARSTLLDLIRDRLHLTGAKRSCSEQRCGACTVLVGGLPVSACTYLAYECDGEEVLTIEGLANGDHLNVVQETFIEEAAVQCGFCTPGMILTARALLNDIADPSAQLIEEALIGNICRCTGYESIRRAVVRARDRELGR